MDAIELLTQDHRNVEELFGRFGEATDPTERRQLVDQMIEELSLHAAIEERELYPVMREVFTDEEAVEEAEHEHSEAKAILAALSWMQPDHQQFENVVNELVADVRHHVEEEENELFPQLREELPEEELAALGERLAEAKSTAPTKPKADELLDLTREDLYEVAQTIDLEGRSEKGKEELARDIAGG